MESYEIIFEIKEAIKKRQTQIVLKLLNDLDEEMKKRLGNLEVLGEFLTEIKTLARDNGKSNMIHTENLERLIVNYGGKLKK